MPKRIITWQSHGIDIPLFLLAMNQTQIEVGDGDAHNKNPFGKAKSGCDSMSLHSNMKTRPNLLQRNFVVSKPNLAWVGDITYIPTEEGWLYLAMVKDLCTKQVIGYAFSERIDTNLTLAALRMAIYRKKPQAGLIFHSDRGSQYASNAYREELEKHGILSSMSRKGDPYDNAVAENFFSCLKCELVHLTHFATRRQAENAIFYYIECFFNPVRPHSAIGWVAPNAFAKEVVSASVA